jgi:HEPN domain-containing protein
MKPLTAEWVEKAEKDFASAQRELRVRKSPNFDSVCFHSQQSIEKYLKACLQEASVPFRKTHDLPELLGLLPSPPAVLVSLQAKLGDLTSLSIDVRYPGRTADKSVAKEAFSLCRRARRELRIALGLPAA